jgi:hypothetical protein
MFALEAKAFPSPSQLPVLAQCSTIMMRPTAAWLPVLFDIRSLAVCVILVSRVYAQEPICYGQEGVQSDTIFACQPNAAESACCSPGDICYSNGLCAPGPTGNKDNITPFFWDGCTDSTFKSPECFSACFNRKYRLSSLCFVLNA